MVSVQSPPGGRELPYARVLLLPAIVMAAATGAAVAMVTDPARAAVGWCGAIATLLVIVIGAEAVRRGRVARDLRADLVHRTAYLEQRIAAHDQEIRHFSRKVLPVGLDRLHAGASPSEVIRTLGETDPDLGELPEPQRDLLETVLNNIDREESMRDSAQRAFVNIARRVQAIVHQQNKELREMEEDHGRNPEVFDDLLRIDHGTALIGRLADSIAVLGGGRPGRQWPEPVPLFSVLRGAMSRILEYRRIELHNVVEVAVNGVSVEPIIHAVAELLDNATRYSPPHTRVHVTAIEVQTGIAIEIEDGGVSLSDEARGKAEDLLRQAALGVDFDALGANPRLGMAVVGRLSKMYNMQVSLRQSAYGGVRAVLVAPRDMLTTDDAPGLAHGVGIASVPTMDTGGVEGPNRKPKKRRPTTGPRLTTPNGDSQEDDVPQVTEWTANGLPQRRSRVKVSFHQRAADARADAEAAERAAAAAAATPSWAAPVPEEKEPEPGLWVEAFMEGLKGDPDPAAATGTTIKPAPVEADDEGDPK
ncbi:ATP-binding protein [Streptomyces sp. NBC_00620]|uniref:ATP-binding protein n=1 Tax=unclassified Streptomyces TaxID=2593676 RepID=UPI00224DDE76|nr:ATP-binding protein [Streptomyces sp. NBC_00620]MCX4975884.1 ATP-binding protein [Streptomyces sp. NBC_00620]WUC09975.1 ATP-binding protein [Streptomyces sp. NBC_00564]